MDVPPKSIYYFFSGAGVSGAGAGAAPGAPGSPGFSGAGEGGAGFASSFAAGGFCSVEGPHATNVKLAKNEIAMNNTKSFFIVFTSFPRQFFYMLA